MHLITANTQGNSNVGLYGYATDKYCILGPEAESLKESIEEALKVPVIVTTIAGTSLAGVFLAGNSDVLLVPSIVFDHEIAKLEKEGITVKQFNTTHTALGNNMVCNDNGALAGPMFSDGELEELEELLGVGVHQFKIADIEVVGSSLAINTKGGLIHRDANRFEIDMAQDTLRLPKLLPGSINFGQPYVRAGIIANSNGFIVGEASGGPEITHADEALGFIDL